MLAAQGYQESRLDQSVKSTVGAVGVMQVMPPTGKEIGPAKVAKLRKEAEKRGLDPNVWFNNVELVGAERVGQEPVRYVANIYKYYVAYRLIVDAQVERERAKQATTGP